MHEVAIVAGRRTPIGKAGKAYRGIHATDLLAGVFTDLMGAVPVPADEVGQVLVGCTHQGAQQAFNIGRNAWLAAGLPLTVAATTLDVQCSSGQQSANLAYALIASGQHDVVVAGGVESLSNVPLFSTWQDQSPYSDTQLARYDMPHQGIAAERVATKYGVSRGEADEWGFQSHTRAAAAWAAGTFEAEISIPWVDGTAVLTTDEGVRADTTMDRLESLTPSFTSDGVTTAGNASQLSDGAAAVVLASKEACERHGLVPLAWIEDTATVGVDPELMLEGPIVATERLLSGNNLKIGDFEHIELHEAFAVPICAWMSVHAAEAAKVNPDGGAIGMGHPFGASGARQLTHLAYSLAAKPGSLGLQAMCAGGGVGTGTILRSAG